MLFSFCLFIVFICLFCRLRDPSPLVRKYTLQVLTHLILNDMVKVKGQISELACCIMDNDDQISGLAKLFFHELAKKVEHSPLPFLVHSGKMKAFAQMYSEVQIRSCFDIVHL